MCWVLVTNFAHPYKPEKLNIIAKCVKTFSISDIVCSIEFRRVYFIYLLYISFCLFKETYFALVLNKIEQIAKPRMKIENQMPLEFNKRGSKKLKIIRKLSLKLY